MSDLIKELQRLTRETEETCSVYADFLKENEQVFSTQKKLYRVYESAIRAKSVYEKSLQWYECMMCQKQMSGYSDEEVAFLQGKGIRSKSSICDACIDAEGMGHIDMTRL